MFKVKLTRDVVRHGNGAYSRIGMTENWITNGYFMIRKPFVDPLQHNMEELIKLTKPWPKHDSLDAERRRMTGVTNANIEAVLEDGKDCVLFNKSPVVITDDKVYTRIYIGRRPGNSGLACYVGIADILVEGLDLSDILFAKLDKKESHTVKSPVYEMPHGWFPGQSTPAQAASKVLMPMLLSRKGIWNLGEIEYSSWFDMVQNVPYITWAEMF